MGQNELERKRSPQLTKAASARDGVITGWKLDLRISGVRALKKKGGGALAAILEAVGATKHVPWHCRRGRCKRKQCEGQPEPEKLQSPTSESLFSAFLLFLMECVKHYQSLERRANLCNSMQHSGSDAMCQAVQCSAHTNPKSPAKPDP